MYKEKLINYINNSPDIEFIITVDEAFLKIEFIKENDKYYFLTTPVKELDEPGHFTATGEESFKESIDVLNDDTCKIFVEKVEAMILSEY